MPLQLLRYDFGMELGNNCHGFTGMMSVAKTCMCAVMTIDNQQLANCNLSPDRDGSTVDKYFDTKSSTMLPTFDWCVLRSACWVNNNALDPNDDEPGFGLRLGDLALVVPTCDQCIVCSSFCRAWEAMDSDQLPRIERLIGV
jgi:hypothetical protein